MIWSCNFGHIISELKIIQFCGDPQGISTYEWSFVFEECASNIKQLNILGHMVDIYSFKIGSMAHLRSPKNKNDEELYFSVILFAPVTGIQFFGAVGYDFFWWGDLLWLNCFENFWWFFQNVCAWEEICY